MNDLRRFTERAEPTDELDGLLRRFFRAEMPEPWPAAPEPALRLPQARDTRPVPPRRWFKHGGRFAVAAAVSFFLIGYLALASAFPRQQGSTPGIRETIGKNPGGQHIEPKRPAEMKGKTGRVEQLPLQTVPLPGGGSANVTGHVIREGNNPAPKVIRLDLHQTNQ